jgi:hypothetical protein
MEKAKALEKATYGNLFASGNASLYKAGETGVVPLHMHEDTKKVFFDIQIGTAV